MATVAHSRSARKPATTPDGDSPATQSPATAANALSLVALRAIAWCALAKHAGKQADAQREDAPAGTSELVRAHIVYEVQGRRGVESIDLQTAIEHDQIVASSSVGVSAAELIAHFVGKMNANTRASVLRTLVETWQAGGESLPTDPAILSECEATLKNMRRANKVNRKGAVRVTPAECAQPLAIVG